MLLVEDVSFAVAPIWETLHIRRLCQYRLALVIILLDYFLLRNDLEVLVRVSRRGAQVHSVWVDDLGLLLQVERLTVLHYYSFFEFISKVLLIPRSKRSWIRIPDKLVRASRSPAALVPLNGVTLNGVRLVKLIRNAE